MFFENFAEDILIRFYIGKNILIWIYFGPQLLCHCHSFSEATLASFAIITFLPLSQEPQPIYHYFPFATITFLPEGMTIRTRLQAVISLFIHFPIVQIIENRNCIEASKQNYSLIINSGDEYNFSMKANGNGLSFIIAAIYHQVQYWIRA